MAGLKDLLLTPAGFLPPAVDQIAPAGSVIETIPAMPTVPAPRTRRFLAPDLIDRSTRPSSQSRDLDAVSKVIAPRVRKKYSKKLALAND